MRDSRPRFLASRPAHMESFSCHKTPCHYIHAVHSTSLRGKFSVVSPRGDRLQNFSDEPLLYCGVAARLFVVAVAITVMMAAATLCASSCLVFWAQRMGTCRQASGSMVGSSVYGTASLRRRYVELCSVFSCVIFVFDSRVGAAAEPPA